MVVGSNDSFLPSRRNGETVETTKGSWERASASSRVPLLFLRGNFFEQTDSRRSPCYEEWPATTSSSLLFFCRTRSPPFPSLYRFISYPQRLVQHFFHSQVEIIGFLFPPTRGLIPPPSFFSAPLPPLLPLVSITLLSLSLWFHTAWKSILPRFFHRKSSIYSASCQIWRFISTIGNVFLFRPFRSLAGSWRDVNFYCPDSIVSCRYPFLTRDLPFVEFWQRALRSLSSRSGSHGIQ